MGELTCPGCQTTLDESSVVCPLCGLPTPAHMWEMATDRCALCGAVIGYGVRFLHLGLCDTCREKPAN